MLLPSALRRSRVGRSLFALLTGLACEIAASPAIAAPGDLDASFGTGGLVVTDLPSYPDALFDLAVQSDGKIVGAGMGSPDAALVRYGTEGALDPTFGNAGVVVTSDPLGYAPALALQLYADGRLLTAGDPDLTVRRYLANGDLDATFGVGGVLNVPFIGNQRPHARAVVLQPDGKIVVAGYIRAPSPAPFPTAAFLLMRFDEQGGRDASFGNDGVVMTIVAPLATAEVSALVLEPDGKLVAAGRVGDQSILVRYDSDGALDATFGVGGITAERAGAARNLARASDGALLTVGTHRTSHVGYLPSVARFLPDGTPDPDFGTGGVFDLDPAKVEHEISGLTLTDVALQPDGKILVAGAALSQFTLARLTTDGALDVGFGDRGVVTTPFAGFDLASAIALQPDGRVLLAGSVNQALGVARYLGSVCGDGTRDDDEECDDGNRDDGDGCDGNCTTTRCGNAVVTAGEQCDDGNTAVGDCCAADCRLEADGTACEDGSQCTATATCLAGRCTPGPVATCDDADACTVDDCDPPTGLCRHEPDGTLLCQQQNRARENLHVAFGLSSRAADGEPHLGREVLVLGDHIVARSQGDTIGAIEIFDAETGAFQQALFDPTPNDRLFGPIAALGPDLLVAAEADRAQYDEPGRVDLYDGATFALVRTFRDPQPDTASFATTLLGYAGKVLARDAGDHAVYVFDAATGALSQTLAAPDGDPHGAFGTPLVPLGEQVLVGDAGAVHLFDLATGRLVLSFLDPTPGHGAFGSVVAAHGSEVIVGGRRESRVYVFDPASGGLLGSFDDPSPVDVLFGDPVVVEGDDVIVGRGRERVHVFDAATRVARLTILDPLPSTGRCFGSAILSVFGDRLAISDPCFGPGAVTGDIETGQVYLFDRASGALRTIVRNPNHDDFDAFTAVASYGETVLTTARDFGDGWIFAHRPCPDGALAFGGRCFEGPCADPAQCPGVCEALGCPLCTRCDPASVSCVVAPRTSCVASARPDRTTLFLRRRNQRLVWRWRAGTALADGVFGDPRDGELYGLCLFAEDAEGAERVLGNQISRFDAWRPGADGSFVYHDRTRSAGVERLVLQTGGSARASITARGSGTAIALPPLPVTTRLRVQLQSQSGACWESVHDPVDAGRNDDRTFRAPAASEVRQR